VAKQTSKWGAPSGESESETQGRPVAKLLLMAAWLIPGLGHWLIGKKRRSLVFAAVILASFVTGVLLDGELAVPQRGNPLTWVFTFGCLGDGALYLVRLLLVNGFGGGFGPAFPYGLFGGGDPAAAGYFYGKTFLYTAGLMSLLVVLDVRDIASGEKD